MTGRRIIPTCSFCGDDIAAVDSMFKSQRGGLPPCICDGCVIEAFAEIVKRSQKRAEAMIEANNRAVGR